MNQCLSEILNFLTINDIMPKNIEVTHLSNMYFTSSFNFLNGNYISESIASGADYDKELSIIKSLVEYIERLISKTTSDQFKAEGFSRTDGYAAFPKYYKDTDPNVECKSNAFHEALERYSWAHWWDNLDIQFVFEDNKIINYTNKTLVNFLIKYFSVDELTIISPKTSMDSVSKVLIILGKLKGYGYISGGAAGLCNDLDKTIARALSEFARHGLAFKKMQAGKELRTTFYEERLLNFASGKNNQLVQNRLAITGSQQLDLPDLAFDSNFEHMYEHDIVLHRCLFENQPIFIGGNVNRLCI